MVWLDEYTHRCSFFSQVYYEFKHWMRSSMRPMETSISTAVGVSWIKTHANPWNQWCFYSSVFSDHPDHGGALQHRTRVRTYEHVSWGREQFGSCILAWCCGKRILALLCYHKKITLNVRHNKPEEEIQLGHLLTVHCERNHVYLGWTVPFKLPGTWLHQPTESWIGNTLQYDSYFEGVSLSFLSDGLHCVHECGWSRLCRHSDRAVFYRLEKRLSPLDVWKQPWGSLQQWLQKCGSTGTGTPNWIVQTAGASQVNNHVCWVFVMDPPFHFHLLHLCLNKKNVFFYLRSGK